MMPGLGRMPLTDAQMASYTALSPENLQHTRNAAADGIQYATDRSQLRVWSLVVRMKKGRLKKTNGSYVSIVMTERALPAAIHHPWGSFLRSCIMMRNAARMMKSRRRKENP